MRAQYFASEKRWQDVVESVRHAVQLNRSDHLAWCNYAAALLQVGDTNGYRRACREMLTQFGNTNDLATGERMAKTCALFPNAVEDLDQLRALVNRAVTVAKANNLKSFLVWAYMAQGLVEYRGGEFERAVTAIEMGMAMKPMGLLLATDYCILALAQYRLGQHGLAADSLAAAGRFKSLEFPAGDFRLGPQWHTFVVFHILLREAEALIAGNSAQPRPIAEFNDDNAINLLELIDAEKDAVVGRVSISNGIMTLVGPGTAIVGAPVLLRGDYRMRVRFRRVSGTDSVNVLLPVGNEWALVVLDGWPPNSISGICRINGEMVPRNPTMTTRFEMTQGKIHEAVATVTNRSGKVTIDVDVDGQSLIRWSGPQSAITSFTRLSRTGTPGIAIPSLPSQPQQVVDLLSFDLEMLTGEPVLLTRIVTSSKSLSKIQRERTSSSGRVQPLVDREPT